MAFQAKLPPGGLRAAVENNLRDKQEQQSLTLLGGEGPRDEAEIQYPAGIPAEVYNAPEQFKTIRLDKCDYEGADSSAGNCPVARAIRRALRKGAETRISVWVDKVKIDANCYALPAEATEADRAWTAAGTITTLEFQLSNRKVTP